MNRTLLVALAIIGGIAVIVIVLAGGGSPQSAGDGASDVIVGAGEDPPNDAALADIVKASVKKDGSDIVFETEMARAISTKSPKDVLTFRWDLTENGKDSWIVSAESAGGKPVAALQSLGSNFGASTIDDTLPGSIVVSDNTVTVTIRAGEMDDFPVSFGWKLTVTLDGDRADPASAVVTDTAPDNGPGRVE